MNAIEISQRLERHRWTTVVFATTFSLLLLFVIWYVHRERYIYFWDSVGYHNLYNGLGHRLRNDPIQALRYVWMTVRVSDYNSLPVLLLAPIRMLFGPGRLGYILSLTVIYVFPVLTLFPIAVSRLSGKQEGTGQPESLMRIALPMFVLASMPLLWTPVLLGSPDVGGLLVIFAVLLLYFRCDLAEQSVSSLVAIGLLLGLLILFRRWYAFWVVGFFGAAAICEGLRLIKEKERRTHVRPLVRNLLIAGETAVLFFVLAATPIALRMLTTDYGDIYSAYRSDRPILQNLAMIYDHFGLFTLLLAGAGIVSSVMISERRPITQFLCIQSAITYLLFTRTQDFGFQHFYLVLVTIAIFVAWFLQDVFARIKPAGWKWAFVAAFVLVSTAGYARTFLPPARPWLLPLQAALPRATLYPRVRTDETEVENLLNALSGLTREPGSKIYILSSSFTLNSSIAQEACLLLNPTHYDVAIKILSTNDVDKRDGFPVNLLDASYVVLTIPFGYHLQPRDQRVIGIPAEQIVRGEGIGTSFAKLNYEFPLEDGSSAYIYKKTRPISSAEVRQLTNSFLEFYPNNRDKFEVQ
jgi:hypothetical protein